MFICPLCAAIDAHEPHCPTLNWGSTEKRIAELERQLAEVSKHRQAESERADRVSVELAEAKREIARLEAMVEADNERWRRLEFRAVEGE